MDKELEASSTSKDLGIILDTRLSYDDHVTNLVSSCMNKLSQINRIRHVFERKMLIMIINSLVFSKLYYCSTVWASISALNLRRIQCVQTSAARIVTGTEKIDHITPCLKALKWLPVVKKLYLLDAVMAFKCINGLAPSYLCKKLVWVCH